MPCWAKMQELINACRISTLPVLVGRTNKIWVFASGDGFRGCSASSSSSTCTTLLSHSHMCWEPLTQPGVILFISKIQWCVELYKKDDFLPNGRHLTVNYRSSFFDPLRGCHGNQFGGKSPNDFDLLHWHSKCRNIAIWMSGFIEPINTLHKNLVNVGPVVPQITRGQILTFRMTGKNWYIHPNVSKFAGLIFTNFQWWWTRGWEWLIWHSWMLDMLLWHATC